MVKPIEKAVIIVIYLTMQPFAQNADSIYIAKSNLFSEKLFKAGLTEWYYYFRIPAKKLIDSAEIYDKIADQCNFEIKKMFNQNWAPDSIFIRKNIILFSGNQNGGGADIAIISFEKPGAFYSLSMTSGMEPSCAIYIYSKNKFSLSNIQDTLSMLSSTLKSQLDSSLFPYLPEKYRIINDKGVYFAKPVHNPNKYVIPCWCFFLGPNEIGFVFRKFYPGKVSPSSPRFGNEWFSFLQRKPPKYQKTHYDSVYEKEWERRKATFTPE